MPLHKSLGLQSTQDCRAYGENRHIPVIICKFGLANFRLFWWGGAWSLQSCNSVKITGSTVLEQVPGYFRVLIN